MSPKRLSILAFVLLVLCLTGLIERRVILAGHPLGLAVQAAALLLMIWARLTFGRRSFHATADPTAGGLVTTGPYAIVRHPIYTAVLLFFWTAVCSHPSWLNALLGAGATAALVVRMLTEERLVMARYPDYSAYAARVKRVLPGVW